MKLSQYVALARRESRRASGRMSLFIACIAIGVAAVVVVAGLSDGVTDGVRAEGRRLMAGDVSVEARRPMPPVVQDILEDFRLPVQRTEVMEFVSIVLGDQGQSLLAEVKIVDDAYPFYGQLVLEPDRQLGELLSADAVVVAPELLARAGLQMGDTLTVGGVGYRIAGVVHQEPDKLTISFSMGPRVFMSPAGIARTKLTDRGARVEYRMLLKLPDDASALDATMLKAHLEARLPDSQHYRVSMFTEAQPALRRGFDRIGRYLGLVGLLSLLIGGVGVAQVSRVWLASRLDDIAILRCLGMTPRQVVAIFAMQVMGLALLASVAGAAAGALLLWLLPTLAGHALPEELMRPWQPMAMLRGLALGLGVAMLFALPLLLGLQRVPPVRVLRRDVEPASAGWAGGMWAGGLLLAGIWIAAFVQSESWKHASYFILGLVGVVGFLALAARGLSWLARAFPRDAGGLHWRHGLSHLARPGAATLGAMVALGLGVSFLFATHVVERRLGEQLHAELPANAPSTFFLDVQPDQWPGLETMLAARGATGMHAQPIVTARFLAVDGVPVAQLLQDSAGVHSAPGQDQREGSATGRSRRWALTREQRLTYGDQLPTGNRVMEGVFPHPARPGVSVEESFARDIGVKVGSTITLDVQGVSVELPVNSLRSVDWRTFGINFFLFIEPGPLDDAPQMRVAVARLPRESVMQIQTQVVQAFPNVTLIHIREVMEKVLGILEQLALAVRGLGAFTVISGMIVLGGTIIATQARRAREVALLKAVGMTRGDVLRVFSIEYALTGSVAAAVGLGAGTLLAWSVLSQVMELPWSMPWLELATAWLLTVLLSVVVGLLASSRALATRPIELLRTQ